MLGLKNFKWRTAASGGSAFLAPGVRVYAVGDVHGRADLLDRLLGLIAEDRDAAPVASTQMVFLGDYVDRGPASPAVLDTLISLGDGPVFLRGNHEEVLLDFLGDTAVLDEWIRFGGLETLFAYGLRPRLPLGTASLPGIQAEFRARLPAAHLAFLEASRLAHGIGGYYFVHAGVRPGVPLAQQKKEDQLWIRDEFFQNPGGFDKVIVHGHTPVERPERTATRINVDTGAFATGRLSCAVLEGAGCRFLST